MVKIRTIKKMVPPADTTDATVSAVYVDNEDQYICLTIWQIN